MSPFLPLVYRFPLFFPPLHSFVLLSVKMQPLYQSPKVNTGSMTSLRSGWTHAHILHGPLLGGIAVISMCSSTAWRESYSDRMWSVTCFRLSLERKGKRKRKTTKKHCTVTGCPQRASLGMFRQCRAARYNHNLWRGLLQRLGEKPKAPRLPSLGPPFLPIFLRSTSAFFHLFLSYWYYKVPLCT